MVRNDHVKTGPAEYETPTFRIHDLPQAIPTMS